MVVYMYKAVEYLFHVHVNPKTLDMGELRATLGSFNSMIIKKNILFKHKKATECRYNTKEIFKYNSIKIIELITTIII